MRMKEFSDDLSDLGSVHKQTNDKVDTVHGKVLNLRTEKEELSLSDHQAQSAKFTLSRQYESR